MKSFASSIEWLQRHIMVWSALPAALYAIIELANALGAPPWVTIVGLVTCLTPFLAYMLASVWTPPPKLVGRDAFDNPLVGSTRKTAPEAHPNKLLLLGIWLVTVGALIARLLIENSRWALPFAGFVACVVAYAAVSFLVRRMRESNERRTI